ncbi:hypothetical protein J4234_00260 [Candidatus Woesearchaeota archaeon]|nr:hypothetical protein [Candidatus Woesearchaeota archaeon]
MHKKKPYKKKNIGVNLAIWITAIAVLAIVLFKEPSITGKVIQGKETVFSENLNLQIDESGTYEWNVKNPGTIKSLKATGSVTSNGTAKVYIEKNGTRYTLFDSTTQLFDINIYVLPEYKKIFLGGEILIQIELTNLRGFGAGNVDVRYSIKDSKENTLASEQESTFVETKAAFVRKLLIPAEMKAGTYVAFVEVSTNSTVLGSGSDTFEVKAKFEELGFRQLKNYIISFAAAIALVIAFVIGSYLHNASKKKKEISELEKKAPLERIAKLEGELNALEAAYKSGFISKESYEKDKKRIEERLEVLRKGDIKI